MKNSSIFYAILAILCWSTVSTAFKLALQNMPYTQFLLISSTVALICLFFIAIISKQNLFKVTKKQLAFNALAGLLNPFLYYLMLFKAYSLLPAQKAMSLNYTWAVVLVVLSAVIYKHKVKFSEYLGLFISFFGVLVIANSGQITSFNFENPAGIILALATSFVWAIYWLINSKSKQNDVIKLFYNFLFGVIYIFIFNLFFVSSFTFNLKGILWASYAGVFEMGLTFYFWLKALKLAKNTSIIANLIYITPFTAMILINFVLKEPVHISTVIGAGFIISGILLPRILK